MTDLTQVNRAQLDSALTQTSTHLEPRLPAEDLKSLGRVMGETATRYHSQDLDISMEAYLKDFERLAVRFSTSEVETAATTGR